MGLFKSLFSSSKGDKPEAEKSNADRKNFDILKYDGLRAQRIGKLPYAIKCYNEALAIQTDFETMSFLTGAYLAANEAEKALGVLDSMEAIEPDHLQTLLTRVTVLFLLERDAEAIPVCQHAATLDADNHIPHFLLAKARKATHDLLGAVVDLTKALALKEDFTEGYLLRAELLLLMGQPREAYPDIEKGIELNPEEEVVYLLKGRANQALGQLEQAMEDYQTALSLNPFNEEATLLVGQLLIEEGKADEAIAFFDEAIELNPSFAKAYSERGRAKNLMGNKEGAFEDLKKAIELDPQGEAAKRVNGQHSNFDNLYKGGIF